MTFTAEASDDYAAIVRDSVAVAALVRFPGIGRRRDELSPGLHSHPVGQHVVFYHVTDDDVLVRRFFHRRRDVGNEFDREPA